MIGILTYHFAHNYGAMLQAFALMKYLEGTGKKVEMINYIPEKMRFNYSIGFETITHKNLYWKIVNNYRRKKQYGLFEEFRKKQLKNRDTISADELKEYSSKFSSIIVGSDQVWNTDINHNDSNYFLSFADDSITKIGFSISIGSIKTTPKARQLLDKNIGRFSRLSFREKRTIDFYDELFHKRYSQTCDPVFLLDSVSWKSIAKKPQSDIPKRYILYYSLCDDINLIRETQRIAAEENIPIVSIHPLCKKNKIASINLTDVGPEQFLWLIDNAVYVASNSFHATAFSIILGKKALIVPHPVLGDRNKDLLDLVHIGDKEEDIYDFSQADISGLNELILFSKEYLNASADTSYEKNTDDELHSIVLGVKIKDINKRMQSQSGGAATMIAEYFIKHDAIVYGVGFNDKLDVVYHRIDNVDNLSLIKGSKYTRAYLGSTFQKVVNDLKEGRRVLFIGNACVNAGLIKLTTSLHLEENLFTVDFICHGTPSQELYKEYLLWAENKAKRKVKTFDFRYKNNSCGGWKKPVERVVFNDNSQIIAQDYTSLFYADVGLRPSCSICRYASYKRISDFTVGDYWGVENISPNFYDKTGVSILMLNSMRTRALMEYINEVCEVVDSDVQKCQQPNMIAPTPIPAYRELFWKSLKQNDFYHALSRFTPVGGIGTKVRKRVYKYIGRWI